MSITETNVDSKCCFVPSALEDLVDRVCRAVLEVPTENDKQMKSRAKCVFFGLSIIPMFYHFLYLFLVSYLVKHGTSNTKVTGSREHPNIHFEYLACIQLKVALDKYTHARIYDQLC